MGPSAERQVTHAVSAMLEAMGDHEFYCSCYSSKEAPQIDGLLVTLADGLDAKTREIAAARESGEIISVQEFLLSKIFCSLRIFYIAQLILFVQSIRFSRVLHLKAFVNFLWVCGGGGTQEEARRILHRLMSSTNRRMHKGFPEMLTYLLRRPMEYCSHEFEHFSLDGYFRGVQAAFHVRQLGCCFVDNAWRGCKQHLRISAMDYVFRPIRLDKFPLCFSLPVAGPLQRLARDVFIGKHSRQ